MAKVKTPKLLTEIGIIAAAFEYLMFSFRNDLDQLPRVLSLLPLGKTPGERETVIRDRLNSYMKEISEGLDLQQKNGHPKKPS